MANNVIILGQSGTGKSTSIKNLDPKDTVIINVLGKKLPFKGSSSKYNSESKNLFRVDDYTSILSLLQNINDNAPHVRQIIIDDVMYLMRKEYFKRSKESGYGKYTELAAHFQQIIALCESMREDLNIFFIMHTEDITSDGAIVGYKVATIGKLLDSQYSPIECVPMVLFSAIQYDEKGYPKYGFYTHRFKEGSIEIPAKTPNDMFEEDFIENDLLTVVNKMNEYYN